MKAILMIMATILTLSLFESCYYDKAELLYPGGNLPCDTSVVAKFSTDILPVITASCNNSGCHNSTDASGSVILDTYADIKIQADNGRLMGSTGPNGSMPKGASKLSSCTLAKIQQWINSGTPNN